MSRSASSPLDTEDPTRVFIWTDERFDIISWFVATPDRPFKTLDKLYHAGPIDPEG